MAAWWANLKKKKEVQNAKGGEEEKKEEHEKGEEIVLKVDMHCKACTRKVARAFKGFEGVEEVKMERRETKVVVKGRRVDPKKVWERLKKKSGGKVELISPLPKETNEENKEASKENIKDEPPAVAKVKLGMWMHCEGCAQVLQKQIRKIKGVEMVETDIENGEVIVKGVLDPTKLEEDVYKKTKKRASIVKEEEEEEKKRKEKEKKSEMKRKENWASKHYLEYYAYPPHQFFSDENPNACSLM